MQQTRVGARFRGATGPWLRSRRDWPEARLTCWVAVCWASRAASRRDSTISWVPTGALALESGRVGGISVVRKEALAFLGPEPRCRESPGGGAEGQNSEGISWGGSHLSGCILVKRDRAFGSCR